jgi:SAM-dependent methyltransferase
MAGNGQGRQAQLKIQAWLTPMSDHFPTPRGGNFLSAPILPSSPSTVSADGSSPTTSSRQWNRASVGTENTEFEDIYDVSEDEDDFPCGVKRSPSMNKNQQRMSRTAKPLGRLIIPPNQMDDEARSAVEEFKKITSPVPLTPSAQLTMSPAQMYFMDKQQAQDVPTMSAPPSLDGSLSSEQLAAMSAPPTPVIGNEEEETEEAWAGVHLQPDAMATLNSLSNTEESPYEQPSQVLELPQTPPEARNNMWQAEPAGGTMEMRQQPLRLVTSFAPPAMQSHIISPSPTRRSLSDLTKLDIPSPSGFFSGLSPRTRTTWHMPSKSPEGLAPPTSTTAEQFYRCPWNMDASCPPVPVRPDSAEGFYRTLELASTSSPPVERVIEVQGDDLTDDMPTARPVFDHKNSNSTDETVKPPASPEAEDAPTEIVVDYDPNYARKQQEEALSNFDRTELWLMAQRVYLKGVDEVEDGNALQTIAEDLDEEEKPTKETEDTTATKAKKTVRFSDVVPTTLQPKRLPSKLVRQESAYYRAFQDYIVRAQLKDVFVYQSARFEALQAQRVALREFHRSQLLGKYQLSVVPQSAKKRLSANVARDDHTLVDDPEKLRLEKELEAMKQMTLPTWHVAAVKFLNGGSLISAPVSKRLARLSRVSLTKSGSVRDRARILDLGGQSTCDWAWHCSLQYPSSKVYTVTTKAIRQMSNSNIRGPPNHRQVAVERLTRLPFPDNNFDLVSARELHGILKFVGENGEDEWESCLQECMRVLKPGGYLEFSLLDSDIMNAGPLGLAKSVEFGFALKTLGYDPSPSKLWLGRLGRAGFQDVRRAWMCLPVGARQNIHRPPTPPLKDNVSVKGGKVCQMEAMVMGSSDNIAGVCSMVGGWTWERWLLRCEMEKVAGELRLADTVTAGSAVEEAAKCLDGIHAVMQEGRNCKAGFRMLKGYAMKPPQNSEVIKITLGE